MACDAKTSRRFDLNPTRPFPQASVLYALRCLFK
jgi:hypothetical protein